jgi:DNA-binding response OmpR family regulator
MMAATAAVAYRRTAGSPERGAELPPILVVEHDPEIGRPIIAQLAADGYPAQLALTAEHARVLARGRSPLLAVLCDLEQPRAVLDLLVEIRGGDDPWPTDLPVIVLSSQAAEPDVLRAFDAGADDFLARPASYLELRARLRAVLTRAEGHTPRRIVVGRLVIDHRAHAVSIHGRPVELRHMEYKLLLHLARDAQRVTTKDELMRVVWGYVSPGITRTLDSHASRLRCKLRTASDELWVVNVRGVGYRLI